MKLELGKGLAKPAYKIFSLTTFILAVLAYLNVENWLLRIFTQCSLCLMMLFLGLYTAWERKQKYKSGYIFIGGAVFVFYVMINTIVVGLKIGAF